jgi:hypothetical protein
MIHQHDADLRMSIMGRRPIDDLPVDPERAPCWHRRHRFVYLFPLRFVAASARNFAFKKDVSDIVRIK